MLKIVFNILLLLVGFTEAFSQNPLPNVIIIMADDMGYGDPMKLRI